MLAHEENNYNDVLLFPQLFYYVIDPNGILTRFN